MTSTLTPELTEDEILARYGPLLWEALASFGEDPTYFVEMAESANLIEYKRRLWEARSEAVASAKSPDEVRNLTERILARRGITAPRKRRAA